MKTRAVAWCGAVAGLVALVGPGSPTIAGCVPNCPPDAITTGEACSENLDQLCGGGIPNAITLYPNQVVCGSAWADSGERDTDWFELEWPGGDLTLTLAHEFGLGSQFTLLADICPPLAVLVQVETPTCVPSVIEMPAMPAGTYALFVAQSGFEGSPCSQGLTAYTLSISGSTMLGACCASECDCYDEISQDDCLATGGLYQGGGTQCQNAGSCPSTCQGDVNLDGQVDSTDLNMLLADFGGPGPGDLICNGVVDTSDLNTLLANFGNVCAD
jgi:hypothetical protein